MKFNLKQLDSLIYLILLASVIFLFVARYSSIFVPVLVFAFICCLATRNHLFVPKQTLFFIFFILVNILQFSFTHDNRAFIEIFKNAIYILIFLISYNINPKYNALIKNWRLFFLFCFFIQLAQFFVFFNVNGILEKIYGHNIYLDAYSRNISLKSFRSGSIFININPYWKFSILSALIFLYDFGKNNIYRRLDLFLIITAFFSTLLTGSRTGLAIFMLIFLPQILKKFKKKFVINIVIFLSLLLPILVINIDTVLESRALTFQNYASLTFKFKRIFEFFNNDATNIVFGLGAYDYTGAEDVNFMDSDYGYAMSYYGIVGLILYFIMLIKLFYINKASEEIKFFSAGVLILIFLGAFTDGVYFNYRIFSLLLLATVPIFRDNKQRLCSTNITNQ